MTSSPENPGSPHSSPHTDETVAPDAVAHPGGVDPADAAANEGGDARDVRPDLDEDAAQDEASQPGVDPDWEQTPTQDG